MRRAGGAQCDQNRGSRRARASCPADNSRAPRGLRKRGAGKLAVAQRLAKAIGRRVRQTCASFPGHRALVDQPELKRRLANYLISVDPTDEGAYRVLMRLAAAREDFAETRVIFEQLAGALRRELDREPSPEMRALRDALMAGAPKRPWRCARTAACMRLRFPRRSSPQGPRRLCCWRRPFPAPVRSRSAAHSRH